MATSKTNSDALGYYLSGTPGSTTANTAAGALGGARLSTEVFALQPIIDFPIGPVVVCQVLGDNTEGIGYIRAATADTLAYTAPGDTEGTAVTVNDNTFALLESGTSGAVRVYRDSVYNSNDMGGRMEMRLEPDMNNALAMDNVSSADRAAGKDFYRAIFLHNHSPATISNLKVYIGTLGTQRTTDSAQLAASGAGTITTTGSFADWPDVGWAHIKTSGGTTREIVYYTSRTATSLTVGASGRARLGTSAAAGASDDTVDAVPGIRIGFETPDSNGEIQTIADEETAPSTITWDTGTTNSTGLSVSSLTTNTGRGLWIHREIAASSVVNPAQQSRIVVEFDYNAVTYTHTLDGYYRVADSSLALYELYIGVDAAPDFTATPDATSATLPFNEVITPPVSGTDVLNYATRQVNQYGLSSFNVFTNSIEIDTSGNNVTAALTPPTVVEVVSMPGGEVDVTVSYSRADDSSPADTWLFYVTSNGVDPNPASDTPTSVTMTQSGLARPTMKYRRSFGAYDYGTTFKLIARVQRSSDSAESANVAVTSHTVTKQKPIRVNWGRITTPTSFGLPAAAANLDNTYYYDDPTNTCFIRNLVGETVLYVNTSEIALRGVSGEDSALRIDSSWEWHNVAHSTAGASTPIEAVSATEVYINVNGTRRAKIDATNNRIEAATFHFLATADSVPVIGPIYTTTTETYIQIFNAVTGRWSPAFSVDNSGVFTADAAVIQALG